MTDTVSTYGENVSTLKHQGALSFADAEKHLRELRHWGIPKQISLRASVSPLSGFIIFVYDLDACMSKSA